MRIDDQPQMADNELQPEIWTQSVEPGQVRAAAGDSIEVGQLQARGYLVAVAESDAVVISRRLIETLFMAYYANGDDPPLRQLQRALARISALPAFEQTQLVAAVFLGDRLYLANTAGGRALLWREGTSFYLTHDPSDPQLNFYRPLILAAGDRILLGNADFEHLFSTEEVSAGPLPQQLKAVLQRNPSCAGSIGLVTVVPSPSARFRLQRWQAVVWLVLMVVALLQLGALMILHWFPG